MEGPVRETEARRKNSEINKTEIKKRDKRIIPKNWNNRDLKNI